MMDILTPDDAGVVRLPNGLKIEIIGKSTVLPGELRLRFRHDGKIHTVTVIRRYGAPKPLITYFYKEWGITKEGMHPSMREVAAGALQPLRSGLRDLALATPKFCEPRPLLHLDSSAKPEGRLTPSGNDYTGIDLSRWQEGELKRYKDRSDRCRLSILERYAEKLFEQVKLLDTEGTCDLLIKIQKEIDEELVFVKRQYEGAV